MKDRGAQLVGVQVPENLRTDLVSIGVPVYNGARYLRSALDSLVAQDYADFEIIISDNASEDETEAICRDYAARDARIRYYRAERNMGPVWNAVRVYELARGEYFMLAAHDDLRHGQYLSRCVAELERNPRALFCCTGVNFIDVDGHDITDVFPVRSLRPVGATPRERLRALARSTFWLDVYSLIRTPALQDTTFGQELWGGDILIVSALCLRGEVAEVPERLFSYRCFLDKSPQDIAHVINPAGSVAVSWIQLTLEMLKCIWRAPLGLAEKIGLSLVFVSEFCVRNRVVNGYIHEEGFSGLRHALAWGRYRSALAIATLAAVITPTTYIGRLRASLLYRFGRARTRFWRGQRATPGAK
ncbi:MAG TPA: glycosyltransferase family 2 protein [Blastocatellia bacterium]|nr:glycosyltransferase family 2 protein [Blastocatellia bacterium]